MSPRTAPFAAGGRLRPPSLARVLALCAWLVLAQGLLSTHAYGHEGLAVDADCALCSAAQHSPAMPAPRATLPVLPLAHALIPTTAVVAAPVASRIGQPIRGPPAAAA